MIHIDVNGICFYVFAVVKLLIAVHTHLIPYSHRQFFRSFLHEQFSICIELPPNEFITVEIKINLATEKNTQ